MGSIQMNHAFCVELSDKKDLKTLSLSNGPSNKVMMEGSLGRLKSIGFIGDYLLDIHRSRGIFRMDLKPEDIEKARRAIRGGKAVNRPRSVTAMAIVTLVGWMATVGSWVPVISGATPMPTTWPQSYIGMVWGFIASDLLWSQLFSVIAVVGLWRMKNWGWTAALMINTTWIYTMTLSLVRALVWQVSFEILFFTPFMIYAVIASIYLWKIRGLFWTTGEDR